MGLSAPGATPATACPKCERRRTKPGFYQHASEAQIQRLAARVLELDRLRCRGASFAYPDALLPIEWRGLDVLERAEREWQSKRDKEPQGKQANAVYDKGKYESDVLAEIKRRKA